MKTDPLRMAAFLAYLLSWVVLAVAALVGALPRLRRGPSESAVTLYGLLGTVAQACALFAIVLPVGSEPLRPAHGELVGVLLLAPLAAGLFVWAQRSAPASPDGLVTGGAYARLRHPIYLAFFLLLLATGLLVSSRVWMILPIVLYVVGTEMRIAGEEADLARRFPEVFADYQRRTRWRYLPGLR
jgi:protein-S-isoprenylcysteine O-methyltransferase Ste14